MANYSKEEERRATMRKIDLGEGVSISMGVGDKVDYFFTNKLEGVKVRSKQALGDLEVEISSTQADDEQLLKKLHSLSQ